MQYGDTKINHDFLVTILGFNHNNVSRNATSFEVTLTTLVSQRDAGLLHLTHKVLPLIDIL